MRIAFDLDGVLANLQHALEREADRLFPHRGPGPRAVALSSLAAMADTQDDAHSANEVDDGPDTFGLALTPRERRRLWRSVRETADFWESLDETHPGVVRRLASLAGARRWEVLFITNRFATAGRTAQLQSQRWLERHGFALPAVYVVRGSRGTIAAALHLDVVVDDRPEHCVDVVAESVARPILVSSQDCASDMAKRMGIGQALTTSACLDALESLDPSPPRSPMRERLGALFGLRPAVRRPRTVVASD